MLAPLPIRTARLGQAFFFNTMAKSPYAKPALSFEAQLQLLQSRGLMIQDESKALHILRQISYYRLSAYWYPFLQDKKNHIFKPGASFDAAFQLYCFDRELRHLVQGEVEKVEIAVRTQVIYVLSHRYGPFWFRQSDLFSNPAQHAGTLEKIKHEHSRSDESFIKKFNENYSDALPPSWMLLEIISFGTLSQLYKNLKPGREKRRIANFFGLSDSVFETWLHSIVYLRNVCAHHTRLWNRVMRIQPVRPSNPTKV
jgi:abortive infection bacteriophage resistance protein